MTVQTYKHFLQVLENRSKSSPFHRFTFALILTVFLLLGSTSIVIYQYWQQTQFEAKLSYLQKTNADLLLTYQAMEELQDSLNVAGAKIVKIDKTREEATPSAGYHILLDDTQRVLFQLETIEKNIKSKKAKLETKSPPSSFDELNKKLIVYFGHVAKFIEELKNEQSFAKEILTVLGPNLYLPTISTDSIWTSQDPEIIRTHFQTTKDEAAAALINLAKISPPANFKVYYKMQNEYLSQVVSISDKIINSFSVNESPPVNPNDPNLVEKAYENVTKTKDESDLTAKNLLDFRLKIFDFRSILSRFTQVNSSQNSLIESFNQASSQVSGSRNSKIKIDFPFGR